MKNENGLQEIIELERTFLNKIKEKKELFNSFNEKEKYSLSVNIVSKIISIQEDVLNDNSSLIKFYGSLRYILETLIQTELLVSEPSYAYKLFYSLYNHQSEKSKKYIERIEKEISIMKNYELKDRENSKIITEGIEAGESIENTKKKHDNAQKELDDNADIEYTMFCGNYKWFGYGYTQSILESKILPEYKNRLELFDNAKIKIAKEILKNNLICELFDFKNQHTRVFKELKDIRSWEEKARVTRLGDEYKLVYDLSSAILHSTSYSYGTTVEIPEHEIEMVINLCFKYSKKIMLNINSFSKMDFYQKFIVINVEA